MKSIKGVITALACPFLKGEIDYLSLEKLLKDQIKRKVQGFVVCGTTGESPTIRSAEKRELFSFIKDHVPQGFPLIMGTGTNSTENTIKASLEAQEWGADASLVVVPYYNKPPQRGLIEHFNKIADSTQIPIILYNVPGRTITGLELESIIKLSDHPNILGIKEATGNIEFAKSIRAACRRDFVLLSGDDATYDQFMKAGGDGAISVASHVIPEEIISQKIQENLDIIQLLFSEANPIPLKMALYVMGLFRSPELRLPLVPLSPVLTEKMKELINKKGLKREL